MDPSNILFPLHYDPCGDVYEVNLDFLFKEEEPDLQIDLTADDKDDFGSDEYNPEINLLNVAGYLNKNQSFSYEYDNLELTDHITSKVIKENDNSCANNECIKTLDKNEESSLDDEVICNLDEYFAEMRALDVDVVKLESNEIFYEYQNIKDVTGDINTTNKYLSTDLLEQNTNNNDVVTCDKPFIDEHAATGNKPMDTQSVLLAENADLLPSINETGPNRLIEISKSEANDENSDDETLAEIKKKRLENHKYKIIEETTLLKHSLHLKFIVQPSTSKGHLQDNNVLNHKDGDSIGYHSSDFEFISESEAEAVGFIKNKKHKSKDARRKFSESSVEYKERKMDYKKMSNDYRKEHVIPRGNAFINMFRHCAPMWGGFMENKAFHVTSMSTEFEGVGFDLSMMPQYDDREDEEHIAESKEVAKYIERMYPMENRRRHSRNHRSSR